MRRRTVLFSSLLLLFLQVLEGFAISYIPPVKNYSINEYKAGNQNWAAAQGKNGWMFFGNNRGLLSFDGIRWTLTHLPNNNAVRSIYVSDDNRIYVGSFEEFGFFEIDAKGIFAYTSLKDSVSGYNFSNDEIWTINQYQDKLYFQSFSSFFIYDGKNVEIGKSELNPLYFFSVNGELYAQFLTGGFYKKNGNGFEELISRTTLNDDNVVAVLPYDDGLLLVTVMNGLFLYSNNQVTPWKASAGEWLKTTIANRAVMLADSVYVTGTISNGLIGFSKKGDILWEINQENKLINNTVLGLFADPKQNLWVALDNGLAQIKTSSSLQYADFSNIGLGMVNDMTIDGEDIYMATNQGVYFLSGENRIPGMVPDSEEQSWYISNEDNQLFVGHNKGTIIIEKGKANLIPSNKVGAGTSLKRCLIHGKEILLQSSYSTLSVFEKDEAGKWRFSHNVTGFNNLIKSFEVDFAGNIWVSHMHKGVYRLQLDNSLREVKEMEYIGKLTPESQEGIINVMKLRGRIILTDGQQFYTYDDMSRRIIPYERMNHYYSDLADTYRIVACDNDRYWFVSDSEYALLAYEDSALTMQMQIPFSSFDNPPIEGRGNVYVDKNGTTYFCLNGGFAVFHPENKQSSNLFPLSLASVNVFTRDKRIMHPLLTKPENPVEIDYTCNNITFDFTYPNFNENNYSIRYRLEGFEEEWSMNQRDFTKTYSNLPYGVYSLQAKVYNVKGDEESEFTYPFIINPPFYKSIYAYVLYLVFFLIFFTLLIRAYVSWALNREKKKTALQRQQQDEQLKMQEQQIVRLEKEKLEDELTYKSKELASATLSVISHNEFLELMKSEVQAQKLSGSYSKSFFDKLIRMINENITKEGDWTVFQANFDRIHEKFFVKLKDKYPDLTSGDLRMCALLRLNMPTKDMAGMLNLSVRGVEAARYRLRKKLNLAEGESLTDFVIKFE